MKEAITKIKQSSSFIKSINDLVNVSVEENKEFYALQKFYEETTTDYSSNQVINYVLDTYNDGHGKHDSLMSGYLLMSSGLDVAETFKTHNFTNPYIDHEFLDDPEDL